MKGGNRNKTYLYLLQSWTTILRHQQIIEVIIEGIYNKEILRHHAICAPKKHVETSPEGG